MNSESSVGRIERITGQARTLMPGVTGLCREAFAVLVAFEASVVDVPDDEFAVLTSASGLAELHEVLTEMAQQLLAALDGAQPSRPVSWWTPEDQR